MAQKCLTGHNFLPCFWAEFFGAHRHHRSMSADHREHLTNKTTEIDNSIAHPDNIGNLSHISSSQYGISTKMQGRSGAP
jgi:hypothetical protein